MVVLEELKMLDEMCVCAIKIHPTVVSTLREHDIVIFKAFSQNFFSPVPSAD